MAQAEVRRSTLEGLDAVGILKGKAVDSKVIFLIRLCDCTSYIAI